MNAARRPVLGEATAHLPLCFVEPPIVEAVALAQVLPRGSAVLAELDRRRRTSGRGLIEADDGQGRRSLTSIAVDDLYRENILEHYKRPRNWSPPLPELEDARLEFEDNNPLCGDELRVQIAVDDDDRVQAVRFSGHGCAISQAAASMTSEEVQGMKVSELVRLDKAFVLELLGIDISATRMKCALLSLKVLKSAGLGAATAWEA